MSLWWLIVLTSVAYSQALTSVVTGANGFVGRALVEELLRNDHEVIGLVRAPRVDSEQAYWGNRVKILPYDMLDNGESLVVALSEGAVLYHIASVFGPTPDPVQTAHDNVKGTLDAIRAAAQKKCKVILTSSMAAVRGTDQAPLNGKYYTEKDWNTISKLNSKNWGSCYQWSKMESEKAGMKLAKDLGVPFVSLCPSFVFGPSGSDSSSFSLQLVKDWVLGKSPVQSRLCVDVRDVALAHVKAAERDEGRYIISTEERVPSSTLAEWFKEVCTDLKIGDPSKIHADEAFTGGAIPIGEKEVDCIEKLKKELGITPRPLKETFQDMVKTTLATSL